MKNWKVNLVRYVSLMFAISAVLVAVNCAQVQKKSAAKTSHAASHSASHGCNAADVKVAIHKHNSKFKNQMDGCASGAMGNVDSTAACLKKVYPTLSEGCANCFGEMAGCSASNCTGKCIFNHFSEGCVACVKDSCWRTQQGGGFSLVACTGLSLDKLP